MVTLYVRQTSDSQSVSHAFVTENISVLSTSQLFNLRYQICNRLLIHSVGTSYSQFKVEYYEKDEEDEAEEDKAGYNSIIIKRKNCKVTRI